MKLKLLTLLLASTACSSVFAEGVAAQQTPAMPNNSFYEATIAQLNQNTENSTENGLSNDWLKYFSFNGAAYMDAKAGDQGYNTQGENNQRLSVTNANLAISATPNSWTKFTIVVNYTDASDSYVPNPTNDTFNQANQKNSAFYVDQAYATFGDEERSPFFAQIGTQYLPFGQYDINPIVKSLGHVLTETNATDAQVGFVVPEGFYGSTYIFQNSVNSTGSDDSVNPYNGGAVIGYKKSNDALLADVGVGYINNMSGVDAVSSYMSANNVGYGSNVAALAPYFLFQTGPFGIKLDYVSALSTFDKTALPYIAESNAGAKPAAFDSKISYGFNWEGMNNVLFIGYQTSSQASALDLPKKRYNVGYNFYPLKNVLVGFEVTHNFNYATQYVGDTNDGQSYYAYDARVGVEF